jgi:trehalose 6-phosphate synthase complex regulatory subunit
MSSFRSHRVVIASLFLPNTVVLGESHPSTPEGTAVHSLLSLPAVFPGHTRDQGFKLSLPTSRVRTPAPILSIVEDLKDKASLAFTPEICAVFPVRWAPA